MCPRQDNNQQMNMNFMGGNQQQMQPNSMNGGQNIQMNGNMGAPD